MSDLKILLITSEASPFAKTGGLADVSGSLPRALKKLDVDVRTIMPKYKIIPKEFSDKMTHIGHIFVDIGWRHQYCGVFRLEHNGITTYFIDNEYYFKRDNLYGYSDEAERFSFFCKSVLQVLPLIDFKPDILHCNDWQSGPISMLLKAHYASAEFYKDIKTLFTIHNLKYQGVFPKSVISEMLCLGDEYFTPGGIEFFGQVNFLKAGLVYSDAISTVSRAYAQEIKYDFFGENLSGIIRKRSSDLYGILNGIDYEENDPAVDKNIFANYTIDQPAAKLTNKKELQKSLGLPVSENVPVIGIISRMVEQKGFDLIERVLRDIVEENVQLIVLGSGDKKYEEMFRHASSAYPDKVSCNTGYDTALAQRIYAGSDMFLMPSLFEPCGLSQMISMRYGTVPIVRETGGLKDTVKPFNEYTDEGTGFTFTNYNAHDMLFTIRRALRYYKDTNTWSKLVKRCMEQDFSWESSARKYVELYDMLQNSDQAPVPNA